MVSNTIRINEQDTIERESAMAPLKRIPRASAISPCAPTWLALRKWTCIVMSDIMADPPIPSPKLVIGEVTVGRLPLKSPTAATGLPVPVRRYTEWITRRGLEQTPENHTLRGPPTIK